MVPYQWVISGREKLMISVLTSAWLRLIFFHLLLCGIIRNPAASLQRRSRETLGEPTATRRRTEPSGS
jgi:hypothetical protein